jgi:hypothetical protein
MKERKRREKTELEKERAMTFSATGSDVFRRHGSKLVTHNRHIR